MEQRTKRDIALINLVSEFEADVEIGNIKYLEDKTFSQIIEYYEDEKAYDKALRVAKMALSQYKYRADFYIAICRILLFKNDIEACFKYLQKAEMVAPLEIEVLLLKARAFTAYGQYVEAFNLLEQIKPTAMKGDLVDTYLCEADIYAEMNDFNSMFETIRQALMIAPSNENALELFWAATELSRKYDDCAAFMKYLIDKNPYSHIAWYNLGHAYSFLGEYEEAIDAMEYSFIIKNDFEEGYLDCADIACQIKDYEKAQKIYEEAINVFGEDVDLLVNVAECQMYLNKTKASKKNLYKAIKLDPYNDEVYFFLGENFTKEKKWYSAINAYHKAIEIEDSSEDYYLALAKAYIAVEDYNKATVNFHLAVQDGPADTHYWREFTVFLMKLGLYKEALHILDEAEEFTFGADLLYCRAMVNFFLKKKKQGLRILEEALVEDFSMHTIIFSIAPELEVDKEINSMINYFAGE